MVVFFEPDCDIPSADYLQLPRIGKISLGRGCVCEIGAGKSITVLGTVPKRIGLQSDGDKAAKHASIRS